MPRNYPPLIERFWAKVLIGRSVDCWEWQASRFKNGYGQIRHSLDQYAHRTSWIIHNGPIPTGVFVLHTCDNPPCVNPAHLFLGSSKDNTDDMHRKGRARHARGESAGLAKLTNSSVRDIKRRLLRGESMLLLAKEFSVNQGTVWAIRVGKTWKHIQA